ncbi:hypothetical protein ACVJGD_008547 [Bradyrhizobium sp. USDA 10063]
MIARAISEWAMAEIQEEVGDKGDDDQGKRLLRKQQSPT